MESMTYLYLCTKAAPSELSASIGVVHQGMDPLLLADLFVRITRDESGNKRRNHAGMVLADPRLIKFGARG